MEKKIIFIGNYYGKAQGHTGSVYYGGGIRPTLCSIDYKDGKALVIKKWKRKS